MQIISHDRSKKVREIRRKTKFSYFLFPFNIFKKHKINKQINKQAQNCTQNKERKYKKKKIKKSKYQERKEDV